MFFFHLVLIFWGSYKENEQVQFVHYQRISFFLTFYEAKLNLSWIKHCILYIINIYINTALFRLFFTNIVIITLSVLGEIGLAFGRSEQMQLNPEHTKYQFDFIIITLFSWQHIYILLRTYDNSNNILSIYEYIAYIVHRGRVLFFNGFH